MKASESTAAITAISTQLTKVQDEITTKIADLEAALGDAELPEAAVTALDELKARVQAMDSIVPDATPVPTPEPTPPTTP